MATERVILVADDDPSIRLLCRVNLELEGFRVLEAADVPSAVAQAPEVDVVLLDLHMGGLRGRDVVDPVRAAAPNVPLVLVTGSIDVGPELRQSVAAVITKPFTIDLLIETTGRLANPV
jgi:CheY-like chemotaxis protein